MAMKVVGFRPYDMTAKDTGAVLKGVSVFVLADDEKVTGMLADKFSLSDEKLEACGWYPQVGDVIKPYYNKYGKVDSVEIAQ